MNSFQQLAFRALPCRENPYERWEEQFRQYEASLLSEIFKRNGREETILTATPPGYGYECVASTPASPIEASGPILQIAAHPGDGPDFFYATYLQIIANTQSPQNYHEVLLTDGEGGVDGWSPEQTRRVRREEAYVGAEIVGSQLHFLGYPDGGLAWLSPQERTRLVAQLAQLIGDIQPAVLIVHPPKTDHLDHAASFLLTVAALRLNAQARGRLPALFMHDVEFGLQQNTLWTTADTDPFMERYPMHVPDVIVNISSTHQAALYALHQHQTQMCDPVCGQAKLYADLIDTLARVRGLQLMLKDMPPFPRGQGFSPVVIPDVTSEQNGLALHVPAEYLYRRIKQETW